jgi:hypothetical protein
MKVQYQFKSGAINNDVIRAMYAMYFSPINYVSDHGVVDVITEISEQKQRMMSNFDFLNQYYKLRPDKTIPKFYRVFEGADLDAPNEKIKKYCDNVAKLLLHAYSINYVYKDGRNYYTLQGFPIFTAFRTRVHSPNSMLCFGNRFKADSDKLMSGYMVDLDCTNIKPEMFDVGPTLIESKPNIAT